MPLKKQKRGQIESSPGIDRKTATHTGRVRNRYLWGGRRGFRRGQSSRNVRRRDLTNSPRALARAFCGAMLAKER
ncbi:hypothetical protein EUGRSUZ_K02590 [Eucalyptus grandis]|uniref:Uncharacterized protein n=2 Tax=Eucalyptus grandis TaxID=71139 RepID=A0ACC3IUW3_EUCGR|nr:hypothetical protein EUGRSUZ_K02590 [Eucalyptus grandis]